MKLPVAIALVVLAGASGRAISAGSDATAVEQALRSSSTVSFYFVSHTENYNYNSQEIQSQASVVVKRACGANCHNFMHPVLSHLRASTPVNCSPGQQDLLVNFGDQHLTYSYSGRQAMYQGRCYFNQQGIHKVLKNDGFFFH